MSRLLESLYDLYCKVLQYGLLLSYEQTIMGSVLPLQRRTFLVCWATSHHDG